MTNLTRWTRSWDPFKEMEALQDRLNGLIRTDWGRYSRPEKGEDQEKMRLTEWSPLVDITEDEHEYVITAELPTVKKEDLNVTVENGVLHITGERKLEKEEKGKRYHRIERAYGTFTRSFTLPEDADGAKVNAAFKDGVLRVQVAKSEQSKPKSIDVKVT